MTIQAIETRYKGYRFRSRLEARWAVFFDALDVQWKYEPEGFSLSCGPYLPDFWLPDQDCWIEIKGTEPSEEEMERCEQLCIVTRKNVYCFFGGIPQPEDLRTWGGGAQPEAWVWQSLEEQGKPFAGWDNGQMWCECPKCHAVGIRFCGRAERFLCDCFSQLDRLDTSEAPRLLKAYDAARAARFEHGEHGDRR